MIGQREYEHPRTAKDTMPPMPSHWIPSHYHNDAAPCWIVPATNNREGMAAVYVDAEDPAQREESHWKRFRVFAWDVEYDQVNYDAPSLETDSWDDVLAFVADLTDR